MKRLVKKNIVTSLFFKPGIVFNEMHIQLKHFINVVETSYYFNYMEIATD